VCNPSSDYGSYLCEQLGNRARLVHSAAEIAKLAAKQIPGVQDRIPAPKFATEQFPPVKRAVWDLEDAISPNSFEAPSPPASDPPYVEPKTEEGKKG